MFYRVMLKHTEEGYAVWCPMLPGCWSQGETEQKALENIKDAIQGYVEVLDSLHPEAEPRFVEVT
jgi:predicted RNase H-like HicB family nuclease